MAGEPWELTLERALLSRLPPAPSAGEPEDDDDDVSIEQNAEDRAARLDELMALSSIYGENLRGPAAVVAARMCAGDDVDAFDDDGMDAAIRFDLTVELDETPGRRIEVTIDGEHPGETSSSSSSFSLTHPPPVTLHVIFPRDYPSIRPPMIALTASWLPPQTLDAACDAMEAMWVPGVPVVFEMATWLAGGKFILIHSRTGNLTDVVFCSQARWTNASRRAASWTSPT